MPMTRDEVLAILERKPAADAPAGVFLGFLMIPVAQRFGQWRFTGAGRTLHEALVKMDAAMRALGAQEKQPLRALQGLVADEVLGWEEPWSSPRGGRKGLKSATEVLLAVGDAPYDDVGICVLKVRAGHSYATRRPETRRPLSWDGGDLDEDLDADPDTWLS